MDKTWLQDALSSLLEFSVPQDLINYICSMENERDLQEYFSTLLDFNNKEHAKFMEAFLNRLKGKNIQHQSPPPVPIKSSFPPPGFENNSLGPGQAKKKGKGSQVAVKTDFNQENEKERSKKKTKFVNIYSQEGQAKDVVLLKGRRKCNCEASKHKLINNCLNCGRIVCEQEGVGPCLFCNNLVCTREQQAGLESGSKRSEKLRNFLMKQTISDKDNEIAVQKRDKLLEYDKTSERLTKVIDDESDYYSVSSVWLSAEEQARMKQREAEVHDQLHASRKDKKFTLDFTGRCVIEEQPALPIDPLDDPVLKKINQGVNSHGKNNFDESIANPYFPAVQFIEIGKKHVTKEAFADITKTRIQDRELQEMSDLGMCLSMHQPWASLLVAGIKTHEGRSWYSTHRGTLWIASAAKTPTEADIQAEEKHYREILGNPRKLEFPTSYNTGCLLGCVNVVDCLSQEEYRQQYPTGPSMEPFVFICENPRKLPICFPMKGKHKIFKLDAKLHQAAQKSLKRVNKLHSDKLTQA